MTSYLENILCRDGNKKQCKFKIFLYLTTSRVSKKLLFHSGSEITSYPETHDAQAIKRRCRKKAGS